MDRTLQQFAATLEAKELSVVVIRSPRLKTKEHKQIPALSSMSGNFVHVTTLDLPLCIVLVCLD